MATKTAKIKLSQTEQLNKELEQLLSENISFTAKWDVKNILSELKEPLKNLRETVQEIYKKYGKEEADKAIKILPENVKEANAELEKLFNKQITIKGTIPFSELKEIKSDRIYFEVFDLVKK